jgi:anti-sigma factor RsiW
MPADDYCAAGGLDAAGWVLGALDPGDAERFAQHLPTCRACRLAVAELEPAARIFLSTYPSHVRAGRMGMTSQLSDQSPFRHTEVIIGH